MKREEHWDTVYSNEAATEMSWFEQEPQPSLELIQQVLPTGGSVIDVGGGASCLVDRLLATDRYHVAVLDISQVAIGHAKLRLGDASDKICWIVCDVTQADDLGHFDLWHDRAVFHFLTDTADRRAYVDLAARTVREGGFLLVATFAINGPNKCSGLNTCQYDIAALAAELSPHFKIVREIEHLHLTPAGQRQVFLYGVFQRVSSGSGS